MRDPDDVTAYDENLAKVTIGAPQVLAGQIEIRDYDPRWPDLYAREAERIRSALGDRVVRLEHRLFKGPDTNINLHVFSAGCPETDQMLLFRDWLRANEADRDLYVRAKRELAAREWKYTQQYADAKTAVVKEILARARASQS